MTIPVGDRYMTHVEWAEGWVPEDMPPLIPLPWLLAGSYGLPGVRALLAMIAVSEPLNASVGLSGTLVSAAWSTPIGR